MKHNKLYLLVAGIVLFSMVLAACAPEVSQPIATEVPEVSLPIATLEEPVATEEPTEEPVATDEPTEVPVAPAYEGMVYAAPNCDYGGILKSIEAVDELTVKFTMCVPDPAFPAKAAFSAFQIYPSEYLESTGGGGDLVDHPVGTGPFVFEAWNRGENVTLTRFDGYWGEPAKAAH